MYSGLNTNYKLSARIVVITPNPTSANPLVVRSKGALEGTNQSSSTTKCAPSKG